MPPPKSILIDPDALLAAIRDAWLADAKEAAQAVAETHEAFRVDNKNIWKRADAANALREQSELLAFGTWYDLPRFMGKELTASWRIRAQQAVRALEVAGKVERMGQRIKPTGVEPPVHKPNPAPEGADVSH